MAVLPGLFDLSGQVAVVTGGAGLLGLQHGEALAEAGAHVVVADLATGIAETAAATLENKFGRRALGVETNVAEPESVQALVSRTVEAFGRLDILINNAALTVKEGAKLACSHFAHFEEYPKDLWELSLSVNLTGAFLCSQIAGRQMLRQGKGVIINVASIYGLVGPDQRIYAGSRNPYNLTQQLNTPVAYAVTKSGLLGLTKYLAAYWAGKNIRVNALTPGGVFDEHEESFVKNYSSRTLLGRMAHRDEFKGAIVFLASSASSYMTGANLIVDGGWTAW